MVIQRKEHVRNDPFEIVPIIVHLSITAFLAISRDHRLSDGLTLLARATTSQERVGSHETGRAIEKLSFKRACMRGELHFSHCLARRGTSKKEVQDASKKRSSALQPEALPKLKIVKTKNQSSIKHPWRITVRGQIMRNFWHWTLIPQVVDLLCYH